MSCDRAMPAEIFRGAAGGQERAARWLLIFSNNLTHVAYTPRKRRPKTQPHMPLAAQSNQKFTIYARNAAPGTRHALIGVGSHPPTLPPNYPTTQATHHPHIIYFAI